jgi:hypothetical protein
MDRLKPPHPRKKTTIHTLIRQPLHIQNRYPNPPLRQQQHNLLAYPITPTRHNNDLLIPLIRILHPIISHPIIQPTPRSFQHAQRKRGFEDFEGGSMEGGEVGAGGGIAGGEEEGEREEGV